MNTPAQSSMIGALEAARKAESQTHKILAYIETCGMRGATGKQIANKFKMQTGFVSARLRELQLRGCIKKSQTLRENSYVWYPERYIKEEGAKKRYKAKEALKLIEDMKNGQPDSVEDCLNRLYEVLK